MENLTLSAEACDAHLVRGVIEATARPRETVSDARARAGTIIEMFKGFAPANALEAMIACQCITLQFVAMAAMRDLTMLEGDSKTQLRMRSGTAALNRTLHQWIVLFHTTRKQEKARAAEEAKALAAPEAAAPKPNSLEPASPNPASPNPGTPKPAFPEPAVQETRPPSGDRAAPRPPALALTRAEACPPDRVPSSREALLASTALIHDAGARGAWAVPPNPPGP